MAKPIRPTAPSEEGNGLVSGVLRAATTTLEQACLPYLAMGAIASASLGRPRQIDEVEFLVRRQNADGAVGALAGAGFRTERPEEHWLLKAYRDDITVKVIFETRGAITLDEEMLRRARTRVFAGVRLPVLPPEDLLVTQVLAHGEHNPQHWFDALALLAHYDLDWRYLLRRARHGPRRVLSLLVYAESVDRAVPREAVDHLMTMLYGAGASAEPRGRHAMAALRPWADLEPEHDFDDSGR